MYDVVFGTISFDGGGVEGKKVGREADA